MNILLQIIIFTVFIIIGHYVWIYMKDTFTIKKTKDLNTTIEKYKTLMETDLEEKKRIESDEKNNESIVENDLNQFLLELQLQKNHLKNDI